ncbi:glycoside hydrolase family 130 protein [Paenibacillus puerhi]|uniref:glycoside hydrolase family 130 protein n=1 Tax=Paenibacillus puerhi TaxID=2692622 RepID=UPI00135AE9E9|nr:glycoside hydrolase family 130 protein [Paenibacillus puerhi]
MGHVYRYEENPLLTPSGIKPLWEGFEVIGAFNAGIARMDGQILMLLRVAERPLGSEDGSILTAYFEPASGKAVSVRLDSSDARYDFSDARVVKDARTGSTVYLTSISYLRLARSTDGRHFAVDDQAFLLPASELETFGVEDPRITRIGDTYCITYSAVSSKGVGVGLASTRDFVRTQRHGLIFPPENKDVILFPESIGGLYYALTRPVPKAIGQPEIWISESPDLLHWGNHRFLMGLREDAWDSGRIGGGAVPLRVEAGWLELYHAADRNDRYCMGAVLLDADDPGKVLARTPGPILEPETDYELHGFFGGVVFSCGVLLDGDTIRMYYGAADTSMACAELSLSDVLAQLVFDT